MASIQQVQRGFTRFIDNQVAGAFDGWQKVVVLGGATLIAANLPNLISTYTKDPIVSALGIYNAETNSIDVDALYNAFVPNMASEKIPVTIPKIGAIKLGKEEFDVLLRYIKEA